MVFYFVQRGETLYAIARRYQTTVHAIVAANRLEDPNAICPGQALIIPRPGEVPSPPPGGIVHLVRPGETVFQLATKFGTTPHDILRANQVAHPEFILPGQQLVIPERMEPGDDWPMLGRTPGRAGTSPVVLTGVPTEGWSYTPRKSIGALPSAPVVRYDRVYVGLGDGHFYSFDRQAGRVKWRVPLGDTESVSRLAEHPLATPAVFDGLAYLCSPDGTVYAVDAYSGQHVWKVALGGVITSSPAASEGIVYVGCWDEHVYAVEAKTGAIAWKRHVGAPVKLPVAVGDDQVFAVADDGFIWALDGQTGDVTWKAESDAAIAPVFAEVVLLAGGRAHDPSNGQVLWRAEAGGAAPVARLDQVIFPGGSVDLFSGLLRTTEGSSVQTVAGPEEAASAEVCQEEQGLVTVVPPSAVPVRTHVAVGPLVIGVGEDDMLHAWTADRHKAVWTVSLGGHGHQPIAVGPGQIVYTLTDGSVRTLRFAGKRSGEPR